MTNEKPERKIKQIINAEDWFAVYQPNEDKPSFVFFRLICFALVEIEINERVTTDVLPMIFEDTEHAHFCSDDKNFIGITKDREGFEIDE